MKKLTDTEAKLAAAAYAEQARELLARLDQSESENLTDETGGKLKRYWKGEQTENGVPHSELMPKPDGDRMWREIMERAKNDPEKANTTMTHQPTLMLILGGPAAGKTRFRRERYSAGYVTIDAGEIFLLFPESKDCAEFPGPLEEELNMVGHKLAKEAIKRRYDIVTEMIGDVPDDLHAVAEAMEKAGYRIQVECILCDVAVALERNLQRGPDNISAYFTQHFHQKWLIAAADEFSRTTMRAPNEGVQATGSSGA